MRTLRRLPLALVLAGAVVLPACADTYQVAAKVGDVEISHGELEDELAAWADSPELLGQLGMSEPDGEGRYPQALTTEVLTLRIQGELARQALTDAPQLPPDAPTIDEVRAEVQRQLGDLFGTLPDEFGDRALDDITSLEFARLAGVGGPDVDVWLSPRYGSTGPQGQIEALEGPLATQGALTAP